MHAHGNQDSSLGGVSAIWYASIVTAIANAETAFSFTTIEKLMDPNKSAVCYGSYRCLAKANFKILRGCLTIRSKLVIGDFFPFQENSVLKQVMEDLKSAHKIWKITTWFFRNIFDISKILREG